MATHPPSLPRKTRLNLGQRIGIPILLLFPLLTLVGFFGETDKNETYTLKNYKLDIQYPRKLRYHQNSQIEIWIENTSEEVLGDLTLIISADYLNAFSDIDFLPEIRQPYTIPVPVIDPKQKQLVHRIELRAKKYGSHTGKLEIESRNSETLTLSLKTFIFP